MDSFTISFIPNFNQTRESVGFDEFEDYDGDAVRFQQGYDMHTMEIVPSVKFSIPGIWEFANLQCDGRLLKVISKNESGILEIEEDDEQIYLGTGTYFFREGGETIDKIYDIDFEGDDFGEIDESYK